MLPGNSRRQREDEKRPDCPDSDFSLHLTKKVHRHRLIFSLYICVCVRERERADIRVLIL